MAMMLISREGKLTEQRPGSKACLGQKPQPEISGEPESKGYREQHQTTGQGLLSMDFRVIASSRLCVSPKLSNSSCSCRSKDHLYSQSLKHSWGDCSGYTLCWVLCL